MTYMEMLPMSFDKSVHIAEDKQAHKERLKRVLSSWNFHLLPVDEDGNCFFTSVALGLIQNAKSIVMDLGFDIESPITFLVIKICELLFNEWLGPNRFEYEEFITSDMLRV